MSRLLNLFILVIFVLICSPGRSDSGGNSKLSAALVIAVKNRSLDQVDTLLKGGADPNYKDDQGYPVMQIAVSNPPILDRLLKAGANPNTIVVDTEIPDCQNLTILIFAGIAEQPQSQKSLISAGANVNTRAICEKEGFKVTALAIAVANRSSVIVSSLLAAGADPNIPINLPDEDGTTCLSIAVHHGSQDIADMLVKAGGK